MYLPRSSCIICGEHIPKVKYNLKTTCAEKSNTLLIKFVEKLYKNIFLLHCNICLKCYDLLNELHSIQQREKELYTLLKDHISKLADSKLNLNIVKECDREYDRFSENPLIIDYPENDNVASIHQVEEDLKIPEIDLKNLPIKVKRVSSRKQEVSKPKSVVETNNDEAENKKAFEQIQSSIQLDLSKHVQEQLNKSKPAKNVLCEICGRNFKTKSVYDVHMKRHDNIEDDIRLLTLNKSDDWCCEVCGKRFNQKGALGRHLAIHTGETRYQCEECGKKFVHHSSFNMHRRIHAGQRNFKCGTCNHCFLTGSHLRRHIRATHEKQKRHSCDICGKKFTEHYNLIAHIKIVHAEAEVNIGRVAEEDGSNTVVYYEIQEEMLLKDESLINIEDVPVVYKL